MRACFLDTPWSGSLIWASPPSRPMIAPPGSIRWLFEDSRFRISSLTIGLDYTAAMDLDLYGLSRVVGEPGVLPQRARRLDPSLPIRDSELLIDVDSLNIDAASFKQLKDAAGGDVSRVVDSIRTIVRERGKMQNP